MYVCVYILVYVCTNIYVFIYMYVCIGARIMGVWMAWPLSIKLGPLEMNIVEVQGGRLLATVTKVDIFMFCVEKYMIKIVFKM